MYVNVALSAIVAGSMAVSAQAAPAPVAKSASTEKIICKKEPPKIGSRLGVTRFCGTERDWRAREQSTKDMRMEVERQQAQRPTDFD